MHRIEVLWSLSGTQTLVLFWIAMLLSGLAIIHVDRAISGTTDRKTMDDR